MVRGGKEGKRDFQRTVLQRVRHGTCTHSDKDVAIHVTRVASKNANCRRNTCGHIIIISATLERRRHRHDYYDTLLSLNC